MLRHAAFTDLLHQNTSVSSVIKQVSEFTLKQMLGLLQLQ